VDLVVSAPGVLAAIAFMARQALGDRLDRRGAITREIWAIYPPV
jgi:hypothetical protein